MYVNLYGGDNVLKKNDEIYLTVKSCTVQGSGVCDYNGMTVFVTGAVTALAETIFKILLRPKAEE